MIPPDDDDDDDWLIGFVALVVVGLAIIAGVVVDVCLGNIAGRNGFDDWVGGCIVFGEFSRFNDLLNVVVWFA